MVIESIYGCFLGMSCVYPCGTVGKAT